MSKNRPPDGATSTTIDLFGFAFILFGGAIGIELGDFWGGLLGTIAAICVWSVGWVLWQRQ